MHLKNKSTKVYFIDDYLLMGASKVGTCPVYHAKSQSGISRYSNWKLMKMAISIVVLHSSLPLKLISRFGLLMSFVFFITGCSYIYQKIVFGLEIGFTSLIVTIFFTTGLILFSFFNVFLDDIAEENDLSSIEYDGASSPDPEDFKNVSFIV